MPSFGFGLSLILLPLVLVGLKTIAARFVPEVPRYEWFEFIGHLHCDSGRLSGSDLRHGDAGGCRKTK